VFTFFAGVGSDEKVVVSEVYLAMLYFCPWMTGNVTSTGNLTWIFTVYAPLDVSFFRAKWRCITYPRGPRPFSSVLYFPPFLGRIAALDTNARCDLLLPMLRGLCVCVSVFQLATTAGNTKRLNRFRCCLGCELEDLRNNAVGGEKGGFSKWKDQFYFMVHFKV